MGSREDWLPIYHAAGMRSIYVGDEAIVDVAGFGLGGKKAEGPRHAVNRAERAGYTFELYDPSRLDRELECKLRRVMAESSWELPAIGRFLQPQPEPVDTAS